MGYFKTRCLMAFKDYYSLKENGVLKVKKSDYLENPLDVEENVAKSKTSHIVVLYAILFIVCYLLYWGVFAIAYLFKVADTNIYSQINFYNVLIIYGFIGIYIVSYINVNIRRSNLLRIMGLPLIAYFVYLAIVIYKFAGVMGDFN